MRVLIASGGSGGHIFPAVSLAGELYKSKTDIMFVASKRHLDRKILKGAPFKKAFLTANPMPYTFGFSTLIFCAKFIVDFFQAAWILAGFRPEAVVGFGGYTSGMIVLMASFLKIKTVIHEQNAVPGRTNKILDKYVDKIAVSFPETRKHFINKNVFFTGNPLRKESLDNSGPDSRVNLGLERNKYTLLVMGGSQGASSLNRLVAESLKKLPMVDKRKIQVIHLTGEKEYAEFKDFYSSNELSGKVFGFIESINEAYSACDMAISRSGAAAVFELAAFARPMVLIPYPGEKNNQRHNAMYFAERNAAIYKNQSEVRQDELKNEILALMNDRARAKSLSDNARSLSVTDGAQRLAQLVLN